MTIRSIKLKNYRNIRNEELILNEKLNIIVGKNAQGKTNILESIFVAAFGKSFRTGKESDLVHFEEQISEVQLEFFHQKDELSKKYPQKIMYRINKKSEKFFLINRVKARKISDILSNLNIVLFHPDDLRLIKDGPQERRLFLNREISQISRLYCKNMVDYNRALKQRNKLISQSKKLDEIRIFDEILSEKGALIIKKRLDFLSLIGEFSSRLHSRISGEKENLRIHYESTFDYDEKDSEERIAEKFRAELIRQTERDLKNKTTTVGPHRDDFEIEINGIKGRKFGSQGQQRTAALAVKLSEIEIIKRETGEYPILLLDDVMSELDYERQKSLVYALKNVQVIITTTDIKNIIDEYINESKIITIHDGKKVEIHE